MLLLNAVLPRHGTKHSLNTAANLQPPPSRDYNSQRAPRRRHPAPGVPRAVPVRAVRAGGGGPGGAALFPLGAHRAAGAAEVGAERFGSVRFGSRRLASPR